MSQPPAPLASDLKTNAFGRVYTYQNLSDWQKRVDAISNELTLKEARHELSKGNEGMAFAHGWKWGSDELRTAYGMLKRKATALGFTWSDHLRRYILLSNPQRL